MQEDVGQDQRADIDIRGLIQGVGFRPFVYQLAAEMGLAGSVQNTPVGVRVIVEGPMPQLQNFVERLRQGGPPHAAIEDLSADFGPSHGERGFQIGKSEAAGFVQTLILPDMATCSACLNELHDPADRRYRYPFMNCIHCGPRYTIIDALPYDRERTAMRKFKLCAPCRREYEAPDDRRFHAQATACPDCGPELTLWDRTGRTVAMRDDALRAAAAAIAAGRIVAVKGLGGFHLMVDACHEQAVAELRRRKRRAAKPFAVMYPGLAAAEADAILTEQEKDLLQSVVAPIVLVRRRERTRVAENTASGTPYLGMMLPATPLHHLLLEELNRPVVATSGNLSEEPICIDEQEALRRLQGIADLFLVHNRPIRRPLDDSIMRLLLDEEQVLRCARGLAPFPLSLAKSVKRGLAVGGHLKNTIALGLGSHLICSQHHGDLESYQSFQVFEQSIADLEKLYRCESETMVADCHPAYRSTIYAHRVNGACLDVQHHYAHVLAGMADNRLRGSVLGVAWDGGGYGPDGTVWGGEFLLVNPGAYRRVARLRPFRLPGGEAAVREPRRSLFGLLYEWNPSGDLLLECFTEAERRIYEQMLTKQLNAPLTSSAGRLFDAVAALLGLCEVNDFEGQAAMALEYAAERHGPAAPYDFYIKAEADLLTVDWEPMLQQMVQEWKQGKAAEVAAARFHATLVEIIAAVAERIGEERLVLSGGCFQNALLSQQAVRRLRDNGFEAYWHHRIPPNDGGLSVGQLMALQAVEEN